MSQIGKYCDSSVTIDRDVKKNIKTVLRIYSELIQAKDLKPSASINNLLQDLVGLCTQTLSKSVTTKILQDPLIVKIVPSLRSLCVAAECHLESHWAGIISGGANEKEVHQRLTGFPYYDNYVDLTRMELSAILFVNQTPPKKIAFIGSGPLPLTSLCLSNILNTKLKPWLSYLPSLWALKLVTVVNIDHNPLAISQSRELCQKLGSKAKGMEFACEEASGQYDGRCLREFDVVYLAALVGSSQMDKEGLLVDVVMRMREGALLVVRTAHTLRTLLYPEFDGTTEVVLACLEICIIVHPYNRIVNSVIVGRVRPRIGSNSVP